MAKLISKVTFLLVILSLLSIVYGLSTASYAEIPHLLNYQGKLTDSSGNPVSDGTHSITFRIYTVESGGAPLWEETQSLIVQKGIFSCLLGGVNNLNLAFDKPYWLAVKVGSDPEMTPRQQISASGYAIRAQTAEKLDTRDIINAQGGLVIEQRISDPSTPATGQIWLRTDL